MNDLILTADIAIKENNLDQFAKGVKQQLKNVNTDLKTDDDFAEAETLVKSFKKAEDSLKKAKEQIFESGDLRKINDTITELQDLCREERLTLSKAVKSRKEQIKNEMIDKAVTAVLNAKNDAVYSAHIVIPDRSEFVEQIKGKKTTQTMQDALDRFVGVEIQDIGNQTNAINSKVKKINSLIEGYSSLFDMVYLISYEGDVETFINEKIKQYEDQIKADVDAKVKQQTNESALQPQSKPAEPEPPAEQVIPNQAYDPGEPQQNYTITINYRTNKAQAVLTARRLADMFGRENMSMTVKPIQEVA